MSHLNKPHPVDGPRNTERNEYIPSFISKKPFYIDDALASQDDYLEHQRLQSLQNADPLATSKWYDRGKQAGPAVTKYRKGACANCGAITHKEKDCLQRKRKTGAKWTGKDIQADELVQDIKLGWDAKRDRWNGYDAGQYDQIVQEFNAVEDMRKAIKKAKKGDGAADDDEDDLSGAQYAEETDMGRHQPTSTRQLRLREDTANYLRNLDLDSTNYDPKTRTMADGTVADDAKAEDGFERATGDAVEFERATKYAWEAQERGDPNASHLQAGPTASALAHKMEQEESKAKKAANAKALLEKYGVQEAFRRDPAKDSTVVENERYVEYDDRGKIKGQQHKATKSMYAEDVHINNHTSVWGSWWKEQRWGYACCHSTIKNSYCVGDQGRAAIEEAEQLSSGAMIHVTSESKDPVADATTTDPAADDAKTGPARSKKRPVHEMTDAATEAEMDEYHRSRSAANDPMARMLGRDELVS